MKARPPGPGGLFAKEKGLLCMSERKTQLTRVAKPEQTNPSSGKTLTVTISAPVHTGQRFREDSAAPVIARAARELARQLADYVDPDQVTVAVSYDYPQWKQVYGPDRPA
jgi:hypothetical protein